MFASDLVRALNDTVLDQRVAVLRGSGGIHTHYAAPTTVLGSNGWRTPGFRMDLRTFSALGQVTRGWKPDVLQAHGGEALKYSVLATGRRGIPIVYRRIGEARHWITRGPGRAVYGSLMRRAARVIVVAEALRRETIEIFRVPPRRVVSIPRAIDVRRMEPMEGREAVRRVLGISPSAPVLLSLGALTWEKDPVAQVEGAARVLRARPDAIYVVAGDGPLRPEVEAAVRRLGLEGRVRLLGIRSDVADLLVASDVMLLSSRHEGMPGCLIEAGMVGLPVVAYAVAGVPEVVVDGQTGFLVSSGDVTGLAHRTLEILGDPEKSRVMGADARERCRSRFDISVIAPRYLALYNELVEEA
jgi:glycosyltransferase involved in cell wall biosynthesis